MIQLSNRSKEILMLIDEKKKTYTSELSKMLTNDREPSSVVHFNWISTCLNRMIEMGFVVKTQGMNKKTKKCSRIKMVKLTKEGRKLARLIKKEFEICGNCPQKQVEPPEKMLLNTTVQ